MSGGGGAAPSTPWPHAGACPRHALATAVPRPIVCGVRVAPPPHRYRVSPSAFFQVNTFGAEKLVGLLASLCQAGPSTVLLDVCCGTGTLGLSLAGSVRDRI